MQYPLLRLLIILLLLCDLLLMTAVPAGFVYQVDALWDEVEQEVMGQTAT
jgi:hypothetical protein